MHKSYNTETLKGQFDVRQLASQFGAVFQNGKTYGDCPICGSARKNKTQFQVFPDKNTWACAVCCKGGDVISLVQAKKNCSFIEAVKFLGGDRADEPLPSLKKTPAPSPAKDDHYRETVRKRNYTLWKQAVPLIGSTAEGYLRARRLHWRLGDLALKCCENLPYYHGETVNAQGRKVPRLIYEGPAMLAAFVGADGRFMSLHRTWIDLANGPKFRPKLLDPDTGDELPTKKMFGSKQGGYLKLTEGESRREIRAGEGIETTLSVREAMKDFLCYRAAGDLGNLVGPAVESVPHPRQRHANGSPKWIPGTKPDLKKLAMPVPEECEILALLGDYDTDGFMIENAMQRGKVRFSRKWRDVIILRSKKGLDFNQMELE